SAAVLRRAPAAQRRWERAHPGTQPDRPHYPKVPPPPRVTRSETESSSSYHHRLLGRGRKALERWPSVAILVATINNARTGTWDLGLGSWKPQRPCVRKGPGGGWRALQDSNLRPPG